jgi:hypothetical protein
MAQYVCDQCKNPVSYLHGTGKCYDCRTVSCKKCGKKYAPRSDSSQTHCAKCNVDLKYKRKVNSHGY